MWEGESSCEAQWLKALIISLLINLLKLLKLWNSYHQKIFCPFLCPYLRNSPTPCLCTVSSDPSNKQFRAAAASKEYVTNSWHIWKLVSISQRFDLWNDSSDNTDCTGLLSFKSPLWDTVVLLVVKMLPRLYPVFQLMHHRVGWILKLCFSNKIPLCSCWN